MQYYVKPNKESLLKTIDTIWTKFCLNGLKLNVEISDKQGHEAVLLYSDIGPHRKDFTLSLLSLFVTVEQGYWFDDSRQGCISCV